ncbi:SprB repeat-containing protein, partial [Lacihabitans sp. CS3-21]|uniref:SprB repeat-containing protein n=1 Tax=Lacihabitans sp. CS3-21 TaxID=2487332 RepID=UPI0020CD5DAA
MKHLYIPIKNFVSVGLFLGMFLHSYSGNSQTTLAPGDIMFTQMNTDGVPTTSYDGFSFVLLTAISSGTQISFTDVGWDPGFVTWGGVTGVSEMYYTWTSSTALTCGTEVSISANGGVTASTGSISGITGGPTLNFTSAGESILAYQGSYASPSFISGIINYSLGWGWNSGAPVTSCGLPAALTNGVNAIFPSAFDNVRYNCTSTSASASTLRAALANSANWISDDITAYSTSPNCITGCSSPITATTSQTNVSCNGGSNGTATVVASGGSGGFTYSWSPSGGTSATASGLSSGSYTCTITDAASISITKTFTITQPTAISTATGSLTNVSCNGGSNGSASVSPSGGTPSYTYSWSPSGGTSATATGLSAGAYTVTVSDANA